MIATMKKRIYNSFQNCKKEISFNFIPIWIFEAIKIAKICHISQNSLCKIFKQIRNLIAKECEKISKMQGEIEIDESYFGTKRVRGKRGRGAGKKRLCFCFVTLATASRRYAKTKWASLYTSG